MVPWQGDLKLWTMRSNVLEPTVPQGSTLIVHTQWCVLHRGDIVAFKAPARNLPDLWVLRIRFVPGDELPESLPRDDQPSPVPRSHYWLQGGDRAYDSRIMGLLQLSKIRGVVIGLLYDGPSFPLSAQGTQDLSSRGFECATRFATGYLDIKIIARSMPEKREGPERSQPVRDPTAKALIVPP